ncbi:RND family efflux transporter MFP subunit [Anoxybacillus vitaminiphilus]|uniref:RND family efflux transporter MFP subunit n=1 Tax=Paranoxybacillus vitaminiphilus TaxID=581036 RepID=A0A327YAL6_9BACL|nr:efflux RND transporter periplasmic adaptor subunit [Anoxybacillus vitaminiphilus]RAK17162.1 RND family efflux transporter MFP subunit [Anoxybacillus vitaminiphilus]
MRKRWPLIITAVSLAFASTACSAKETSSVQEEKNDIKTVQVATVKNESLDAISNLSGTLQPYDETIVSFEVGGQILDTNVKIGDSVQKGMVLAKLDPTEYQLQVEQANKAVLEAQAAIKSAEAAIGSADAGVQSADAGIQSAEANIKAANSRIHSVQASLDKLNKGAREQEKAQARLAVERAKENYKKISADAQRIKALYEEGLVSKQEYEAIQLQLSNAQKDVMNAEQSLSLLLEGATQEERKQVAASLEEARAGKEQAEAAKGQAVASKDRALASKNEAAAAKERAVAAYEQALVAKEITEFTLSKTVLKSPISGVVLEKFVSDGQMVNAGSSIYRLGRTDQLKVLLPVPDKEIKEWKVGQEVKLTLYDQVKKGKVSKIYPRTNANTGTISVEVVVPNDKFDWFPGQVVKASRISSDNNGILVPVEAVISNGDKPYVFKVVKGKAVKTFVETGQLIDNKLHIVSGLKEGDKVVVRGAELLFNGDSVKATEEKRND